MSNNLAIEICNLSKHFKATVALSSVNTVFQAKKMHGVIGPEGAGKTTLLRMLVGLLSISNGRIIYKQDDVKTDFEQLRSQIAYMPASQNLYADMSVIEHLDFFAKLYGLSSDEFHVRSERLLSITRLNNFKNRLAKQLSGGMYKKLGLMCAMLRDPKILILDEPTNGVDPISRREFWDLLYELEQQDILIILSTSYMDEAERCSMVHLFDDGKLIANGKPSEILKHFRVENFNQLFIQSHQAKDLS